MSTKLLAIIATTLASVGCTLTGEQGSAAPAEKDYITNIDYTSETPWSVELNFDHVERLRAVKDWAAERYIPGLYGLDRYHVHGGRRIYLFPNHEYAVTDACCEGYEETLELGSWQLIDGAITLHPRDSGRPESPSLALLSGFAGYYRSLRFFVTAKGEWIDTSVLVTEEELKKDTLVKERAFVREVEYPDWPETLRRLKEAPGSEP